MNSFRLATNITRVVNNKRTLSIFKTLNDFISPKFDAEAVTLVGPKMKETDYESIKAHSDCEFNGDSTSSIDFLKTENGEVLRFSGKFDFDREIVENKVKAVKGYCGLSARFKKVFDLREYEGVEITLSSEKKQDFFFNIETDGYSTVEMYQVHMQSPGNNKRYSVFIPFHYFTGVEAGAQTSSNRALDSLQVKGFGLLIDKDLKSEDGTFSVDIHSIEALLDTPKIALANNKVNDDFVHEFIKKTPVIEEEKQQKDLLR